MRCRSLFVYCDVFKTDTWNWNLWTIPSLYSRSDGSCGFHALVRHLLKDLIFF